MFFMINFKIIQSFDKRKFQIFSFLQFFKCKIELIGKMLANIWTLKENNYQDPNYNLTCLFIHYILTDNLSKMNK